MTRRDAGSTLPLMPAAVLVFVILGALSVDVATVHLAQRRLVVVAQAAANDAAVAGLDEAALYLGDVLRLDESAARAAARRVVADAGPGVWLVGVRVDGTVVEVELGAESEPIFGRAVPGADRRAIPLRARARAELRP